MDTTDSATGQSGELAVSTQRAENQIDKRCTILYYAIAIHTTIYLTQCLRLRLGVAIS